MDGYPSKVTQHTDKITVSSYVIETKEYRSEAIAKVLADALRVFSIRTLVATKQTELNKQIITHIVRERKSKFLATDFIL